MKKKVLITGCSKGIGKATLGKIIKEDKYEIYVISKHVKNLKEIDGLHVFRCDLSDKKEKIRIIQKIIKISDGIDILVNNAGIGLFKNIEDFSAEEWNNLLEINLNSPFIFIKYLMPLMKKNNYGIIINITSDADHNSYPQGSLYCASKFGLKGLSDSLRKELKGFNIKVTTIAPGRVDTFFNSKEKGNRPYSLSAEDVADQIINILNQSERTEIEAIYLNSVLEK